jgi:hypothetical protein
MNTQDDATAPAGDTRVCPYCGEQVRVTARKCKHCHEYLDEELRQEQEAAAAAAAVPDPTLAAIVPVGRTGLSIAAGYLGLLSLLPVLSPCLGPAAVVVSILAIRELKANPERKGMGRAVFGLVVGGLVCVAIVVLIGWLVIENLNR